MRVSASKLTVLALPIACAAAAVVFSLTALVAHGRALPAADAYGHSSPVGQRSSQTAALPPATSVETAEVQVSIQPTQSVVALGESFTVAVAIEDAPEVKGYEFSMDWNPAVFSITTIGEDRFLGEGALTLKDDSKEGTLTFAALLLVHPLPAELPSGDGDLVTVTFQATGVGTSTLDLYATLLLTRSGQIGIVNPGDGTAESTCDAAAIVDLDADGSVELGQATHFTATVEGAEPISYTWDFDSDGAPERIGTGLDTVTHAYTATGTYTATLAVDNVCGVQDTATVSVTVEEPACEAVQIAALVVDPSLTAGLPAHFTATVTGAPPITYTWDFDGDGAPERIGAGLDVVTHTYAAAGTYTVRLTVENDCPSQATETLSVTAEEACEDVAITGLTSDSPVKIGEEMRFTATVTGTVPYTYTWDFGDGGAGSGTGLDTATPTWIYALTGTYTVTLAVDNPCGSDEDSQVVTVELYGIFLPAIFKDGP